MFSRRTTIFLCLFPLLTSCVGKKKFLEADYLRQQCEARELQLRAQLEFAERRLGELTNRGDQLNNTIGVLRDDKRKLEADTARLQQRLREVTTRAQSTRQELDSELLEKTRQLEERDRRLAEIRQALDRRDQRLLAAQADLREVLLGLPTQDAQMEMRDGRLVVILSDELVFEVRNPVNLKSSGRNALSALASVVNKYPDLEVVCLGHTNNQRPGAGFADNWELSVRRAAMVVRELVDRHNVSPNQLTVAGKGEFQPAVANDTRENLQRNRRLELVISPRLETIYNVMRDSP
jgi:chemotaxis protein MotB